MLRVIAVDEVTVVETRSSSDSLIDCWMREGEVSDWWLFPVPVSTGKAGPTRRDEISISRMPCRVMSRDFVWQMWMSVLPWMLRSASFPSHLLASARLHAAMSVSRTKTQSEQHFRVQTFGCSHRQQTWTGCRAYLLRVLSCSGVSELQMQPSRLRQCSNLLLNNTTTHPVRLRPWQGTSRPSCC